MSRARQLSCAAGPTCCTCNGSRHPSSTVRSSGRASRRCSPPMTSCRGARRRRARSGASCSHASTASSSTANTVAQSLGALGVEAVVIPHPVFPSDPPRDDDGRTLLCLGTIRPYKGLGDAIAATKLIDGAHLLVAGDPIEAVNGYRSAAGELAEWRLGYLSRAELERALGQATVALFPYRPELDQSGALLQALGAGVPAVAYDVGGHRGAGRAVRRRPRRPGGRRRGARGCCA